MTPKKPRRKKPPVPAAAPEPKPPCYVWVDSTSRSQSDRHTKRPNSWCLENVSDRAIGRPGPRIQLRRLRENEAAFLVETRFELLYRNFCLDAEMELEGRDQEAVERASAYALLLVEQELLNTLDLIREIRATKPSVEAWRSRA